MLVVVEQTLGDVERGDVVVLRLFGEGEDEFVAGAALGVGGLAADGFEALEQVVSGEGGVFADADHGFATRIMTEKRIFKIAFSYLDRCLILKKHIF